MLTVCHINLVITICFGVWNGFSAKYYAIIEYCDCYFVNLHVQKDYTTKCLPIPNSVVSDIFSF